MGEPARRIWWGSYDLPAGKMGRWRIGPSTLWVQHIGLEWRVALERGLDPFDEALEIEVPASGPDLLELDQVDRYPVESETGRLHLTPRLADRPVITRPQKPFHVLPNEQVLTYVGSPVWVAVSIGDDDPLFLRELPIHRPSDTWFGPPTDGELGYSARTFFRLSLEEVVPRPHRAITALTIINRTRAPLDLDHVNLPVGRLSLYATKDGRLWTEDAVLEREDANDFARLRIQDGPPRIDPEARQIDEPRTPETNPVIRAFSTLFE